MSKPVQPTGGSPTQSSRPGRRSFLRGVLGAGAAGAAVGVAAGYAASPAARATSPAFVGSKDPDARLPAMPFHGQHQVGLLPDPQRQTRDRKSVV